MNKYLTYLRINIAATYAYKADFFLYMAINMVFFYISIALWSAVYFSSGVGEISTYTLSNTVTYYLITSFLFRLDLSSSIFLEEEIWSGQFTNDLIKPWNVIWVHFIATISDLMIGILSFIPFLILMLATSFAYINLPTLANLLFFVITIILALIMNFIFRRCRQTSKLTFFEK